MMNSRSHPGELAASGALAASRSASAIPGQVIERRGRTPGTDYRRLVAEPPRSRIRNWLLMHRRQRHSPPYAYSGRGPSTAQPTKPSRSPVPQRPSSRRPRDTARSGSTVHMARTWRRHGSRLMGGVCAGLLATLTWLVRLDRAAAAAVSPLIAVLLAAGSSIVVAASAQVSTLRSRQGRVVARNSVRQVSRGTERTGTPVTERKKPAGTPLAVLAEPAVRSKKPTRRTSIPEPKRPVPEPKRPVRTPVVDPETIPAPRPPKHEPITDGELRELLQPRSPLPRRRRRPRVRSNVPASETFRSAMDSLSSKKLRSALTMLGIVIGVASVIVLVALGNGMKADFNKQFSRLANQITVTPAGKAGNGSSGRNLTDTDVTALSDHRRAPNVASVSPSMSGDVTLTVGQNQERASMVGAMSNYLDLLDRKIVAGQWFTDREVAGRERVAVLGPQAVALLWGPGAARETVIGSRVRIEHSVFRVTAVLESDGQNDNVVIVPFGAARSYLIGDNAGEVDQMVVKSTDVGTVGRAASEIVTVLDENHHVKKPSDRDYSVLTYTNLLNKSSQFVGFLSQFIVAIAAVSLLVGGIGVANIMLVSVTERTREIGIRKAIGATSQAILRQFLSEAVMLTGLGGLVGVGLGIAGSFAGQSVMPKLVADFPGPILSVESVFVAFGVSLAIGLVAGGYPAYRAARMKPIDALRWE